MINEESMLAPLEEYWSTKGYKGYYEVPILGKRIDAVFAKDGNDLVAIEVKVKNWKRALEQAINYKLCAKKVYVALWYEYVHRLEKVCDIFDSHGIGIFSVNGSAELVKEASSSNSVHTSLFKSIQSYIKSVEGGNKCQKKKK